MCVCVFLCVDIDAGLPQDKKPVEIGFHLKIPYRDFFGNLLLSIRSVLWWNL